MNDLQQNADYIIFILQSEKVKLGSQALSPGKSKALTHILPILLYLSQDKSWPIISEDRHRNIQEG